MAAPSSARSTMVGWIVATSIVSIVCIVFAIYAYVEVNRANDRLKTTSDEYADVLTRDALKSDDVSKLRAARDDVNAGSVGLTSSMKLMDVALTQRAYLSKLIGGPDENAAIGAAKAAVDKAKIAGVKVTSDSLVGLINSLVNENNSLKTESANNKANADQSRASLTQTQEGTKTQIQQLTTAMEAIRAENTSLLQQVQDTSKAEQGTFETTAGDLRNQLKTAQDQINQTNQQNGDLNDQLKKRDTIISQLQEKLGEKRIDPTKMIVRQADGTIISLPRTGICYINLGLGDHVSPGLTFEVYDKAEGVPPAGDPSNDDNLPVGKASIEVISVSQSSSECRITRLAVGAALANGDLIANLVYDRNVKYNFVVHGNFDLDRNGNATSRDTEVVKQLITRWGGAVTDAIGAGTDFVVLGKEPAIPEKPSDPNDPVAQKTYEDSVAAYDKYGEISAQARSYHIPILNQNRFLYLCGYYDQAKR